MQKKVLEAEEEPQPGKAGTAQVFLTQDWGPQPRAQRTPPVFLGLEVELGPGAAPGATFTGQG